MENEDAPAVRLTTTLGDITLRLDPARAPETVRLFLENVDSGHYRGTLFHRVIPGFMVQGGGLDERLQPRPAPEPIRNEADRSGSNRTGTVAMARTADPHSATGQFFINLADNPALDHQSATPRGWGYCVFAEVEAGMDVVRTIAEVNTTTRLGHRNVPVEDIVIENAERP